MAGSGVERFAVLMDASAIFFAVRDLYESLQLNYSKLSELLREVTGMQAQDNSKQRNDQQKNPDRIWAMWTSFHSQNAGQARFLEYAENTLGWAVRRVDPSDSYIIDPQTTLGISKSPDAGSNRAVNRLIRFDAGIAYSIGRVADTHKIVLITDSYALAEPLVRAAAARKGKNYIAFFGRLLDPRWNGLLRSKAKDRVAFIDLDEHEKVLFGEGRATLANSWDDDFPIR